MLGSSGSAGTVEVDVKGDFQQFRQGLDSEGRKAGTSFGSSFGSGFGKQVANIGASYLGAQFGKQVIGQASDLAEATNVTGLAFGEARDEVDKLASSANTAFGLTESAYRQLGAQIGNIFVGADVAERDAAKLTNSLIGRATDMGSAWNASTQEVSEAINSGLIGSFEPLRKYGVIIDKAAVNQKALEMGLVDANGEITAQGEKLATAQLILEQTDNVAGDFANTSDGVANSSKILAAQWGDMQAQLGQGLLPVLSTVMGVMRQLGPDGMRMVVVGGLIAFTFTKLAGAASAFGGALKLLAANPWVLVALAIVAVGILIWRNWDTIVDKLGDAWSWVQTTAGELAGWLEDTWNRVTGAIGAAWSTLVDTVTGLATELGNAITGTFTAIGDFFVEWWPYILGVFTLGVGLVVGLVIQNWDAIWSKTGEVTGAIVGFFQSAWDNVLGIVTGVGGAVVGFITGIPSTIAGAFTTLAETIAAPFRSAFAGIKSAWNSTVGGFGFSVPGWIPGVGGNRFDIPSMARGGVVDVPTLAVVGDAGQGNREIVTPERLMFDTVTDALASAGASSSSSAAGPMVTVPITMHVDAGVTDPRFFEERADELARVVEREVARTLRALGLTDAVLGGRA